MWLDVDKEKKWTEFLNVDNYPKVIILNPGKRKRIAHHDASIDSDSLSIIIIKI